MCKHAPKTAAASAAAFDMEKTAEKRRIRISARAMAEQVHVSGSLFAAGGLAILQNAAQAHRDFQRAQDPDKYAPEVSVHTEVESEHFLFRITGRIDGLIQTEDGYTVQEIKTVEKNAQAVSESDFPTYWAQAIAYGHMLCEMQALSHVTIELRYLGREDGSEQIFTRPFSAEAIRGEFMATCEKFIAQKEAAHARRSALQKSAETLSFPFPTYRAGQREMMKYAYLCIKERMRAFISAPTGTGKTAAALYPAVMALAKNEIERVFYLTAQGTNAKAVKDFLADLHNRGLDMRSVRICAKDEMCVLSMRDCSDACPYAQGYYDRVQGALTELLCQKGVWDGDFIRQFAVAHRICPHEFSLDLSLFCDVIVCDLNYVFDPRVQLKRYFTKGGAYHLLIDEAHTLPDRARIMYSAEIGVKEFIALRRALGARMRKTALYQHTRAVIAAFEALHEQPEFLSGVCMDETPCDPAKTVSAENLPGALLVALDIWAQEAQHHLTDATALLRETYFACAHFLFLVSEHGKAENPCRKFLLSRGKTIAKAELFCPDAGELLKKSLTKVNSALFFSATLEPIDFYKRLCGGDAADPHAILPSPFNKENLLTVHVPVDVTYPNRQEALSEILPALHTMTQRKKGHYIAFFPSYSYLNRAYGAYIQQYPNDRVACTAPGDTGIRSQDIIKELQSDTHQPLLVFAVLGGIYAQSVDLKGDALLGCAIITVGLPKLDAHISLIRRHFDETTQNGFDMACKIPGMSRVVQAAGRVIRDENDRGVVLLIDRRFARAEYRALLPAHWQVVQSRPQALGALLDSFWRKGV